MNRPPLWLWLLLGGGLLAGLLFAGGAALWALWPRRAAPGIPGAPPPAAAATLGEPSAERREAFKDQRQAAARVYLENPDCVTTDAGYETLPRRPLYRGSRLRRVVRVSHLEKHYPEHTRSWTVVLIDANGRAVGSRGSSSAPDWAEVYRAWDADPDNTAPRAGRNDRD